MSIERKEHKWVICKKTSWEKEVILAVEDGKQKVWKIMVNESKNEIETTQVTTRLYLVRHYPYDEKLFPEHEEYEQLLTEKSESIGVFEKEARLEELRQKAKTLENFWELPEKLKEELQAIFAWVNKEEILVLYDNEDATHRVRTSAEDMIREFWIRNVWKAVLPKWNYVECNAQESDTESPWIFAKNKQEINEQIISWKYKTVIIIWNRSYAHAFDLFTRVPRNVKESYKSFEEEWYFHADYTVVNNKERGRTEASLLPVSNNKIRVSPRNYQELKLFFPEIEHTSIIDFQNKLNVYFIRNPYLYDKVLFDNSINDLSIKLFCLKRLIHEKKYDICYSYTQKFSIKDIEKKWLIEIFKVLYSERKNTYIWKDILINIISQRGDISSDDLKISKYIWSKFIQIHELQQKNYAKSQYNIEGSLDIMVRERNLISRKISYMRPPTPTEIKQREEEFFIKNPFFWWNEDEINRKIWEYKCEYLNLDKILDDPKSIVLLAHVWEWKSIYLSHLFDAISSQKNIFSLYYSTNTLSLSCFEDIQKQIVNDIQLISNILGHKKVVLFFDGIDELNLSIKDKLKEFLFSNKLKNIKVIIWSRKSEYDTSSLEPYVSVWFEGISKLDKKHFFESRLLYLWVSQDKIEEHISKIYHFLEKGFLDDTIKNTPLVLYFLCTLSSSGRLQHISNRSTLYDEMVHSIFRQFQNMYQEKWKEISQIRDDVLISILTFCAQYIFEHSHQRKTINADTILEYIQKRTKITDKNQCELILNKLFLLFRKTDKSYVFILESFYEFFLWKSLKNKKDGNKVIYDYQNATQNNLSNWKKFRDTILFYTDELILDYEMHDEEKNIEKIKDLLSPQGLMKNDTFFWDNFFLCVEILENIKSNWYSSHFEKEEKYFENMIQNFTFAQLKWRFEWFIEFQKRIWYKENRYLDIYLSKVVHTTIMQSDEFKYNVVLLWTQYALELYTKSQKYSINNINKSKSITLRLSSPELIEMIDIYGLELVYSIWKWDLNFLFSSFVIIANKYVSSPEDMNIVMSIFLSLLEHEKIVIDGFIFNDTLFALLLNIENTQLIDKIISHLVLDSSIWVVKIQKNQVNLEQEMNQNIKKLFIKETKDRYDEVAITFDEYLMLLSRKASHNVSSQIRNNTYEKFHKHDKKWTLKYIAKDILYFWWNEISDTFRKDLLNIFLDTSIHDGEKFNFLIELCQYAQDNNDVMVSLFQYLFEIFFDELKKEDTTNYSNALILLLEKNTSLKLRDYLIQKSLCIFETQDFLQMKLSLAFKILDYTFDDTIKNYILHHIEHCDNFLLSENILNIKDKTFLTNILKQKITAVLEKANTLLDYLAESYIINKQWKRKWSDKINVESIIYRLFWILKQVWCKDYDFLRTLVNPRNLSRKDLNLKVLLHIVNAQSLLKDTFIQIKLEEIFSVKEINTGNQKEYNDFITFQVKSNRNLNTLPLLAHYIKYQVQNAHFDLNTEIELFSQWYKWKHYDDLLRLILTLSPQLSQEWQNIIQKLIEILFEYEDLRDMNKYWDILMLQIRNNNLSFLSKSYDFIDAMNSQQVKNFFSELLRLPEKSQYWSVIKDLLELVQDKPYMSKIIDMFLKHKKYISEISHYIDVFSIYQMNKLRKI